MLYKGNYKGPSKGFGKGCGAEFLGMAGGKGGKSKGKGKFGFGSNSMNQNAQYNAKHGPANAPPCNRQNDNNNFFGGDKKMIGAKLINGSQKVDTQKNEAPPAHGSKGMQERFLFGPRDVSASTDRSVLSNEAAAGYPMVQGFAQHVPVGRLPVGSSAVDFADFLSPEPNGIGNGALHSSFMSSTSVSPFTGTDGLSPTIGGRAAPTPPSATLRFLEDTPDSFLTPTSAKSAASTVRMPPGLPLPERNQSSSGGSPFFPEPAAQQLTNKSSNGGSTFFFPDTEKINFFPESETSRVHPAVHQFEPAPVSTQSDNTSPEVSPTDGDGQQLVPHMSRAHYEFMLRRGHSEQRRLQQAKAAGLPVAPSSRPPAIDHSATLKTKSRQNCSNFLFLNFL